jgi:hypothetical protein
MMAEPMSSFKCTEETFLENIANTTMEVVINDGVYRHVKFPCSDGVYWFNLVTWPNHLVIEGDMGCYAFSRVHDMFEFFCPDAELREPRLRIQPSYWRSKLVTVDVHDAANSIPTKHWSPELFTKYIVACFEDHIRMNMQHEPDKRVELKGAVKAEIIDQALDEYEAISAANNFSEHGLTFDDLSIENFCEWNFRYIWCLYAIVWGIKKFKAEYPSKGIDDAEYDYC